MNVRLIFLLPGMATEEVGQEPGCNRHHHPLYQGCAVSRYERYVVSALVYSDRVS